MDWYLKCFRKYATFSGRARRTEYWMFQLFHFVVSLLCLGGDEILKQNFESHRLLLGIYLLVAILPTFAVKVRRLHDIDFSGWWCFVHAIPFGSLINLFLMTKRGDEGFNRYGADPKDD